MWTAEQGLGDTAPGGKENMFRRGKVGDPLWRSERETSGPWEPLQPGEVRDTRCADFRCRWPVVNESFSIGPSCSFYDRQGSA